MARPANGAEVSVCVLEKGSEIGAHILSGAILEPRALDELIPDWRERGAPISTKGVPFSSGASASQFFTTSSMAVQPKVWNGA